VPGYLGCELGTGGDVQLGEHVREMRLHGPARHVQPVADLRIGEPLGNQRGDSALRWGEAGPAGPRLPAGAPAAAPDPGRAQHRLRAGQISRRVQPLVDLDRLIEEWPGPAHTLRRLESSGLVTRQAYAAAPPRVEYELTELGRTLIDPIRTLTRWAEANGEAILDAQDRYQPA
jgi:HxlR-like helix-turn-helix